MDNIEYIINNIEKYWNIDNEKDYINFTEETNQ